MIDTNPKSPFSEKRLSELTGACIWEGDAWCAALMGWTDIYSIDQDSVVRWIGKPHCASPICIGVPIYHDDWEEAGSLLGIMAGMGSQGDIHLDHLGPGEDIGEGLWGCGQCTGPDGDAWYVHTESGPLSIRNAFIVLMAHRKGN